MSRRICGPGLCHCDKADTCPVCAERKVEAGCDGMCEPCYMARECPHGLLVVDEDCPDCLDVDEDDERGGRR